MQNFMFAGKGHLWVVSQSLDPIHLSYGKAGTIRIGFGDEHRLSIKGHVEGSHNIELLKS